MLNEKSTLLLHVCCGPCLLGCIERLLNENLKIGLLFSNSNLNSSQEFDLRLENVRKISEFYNLELFVDPYDHQKWLNNCQDLAAEPERGKRCAVCFEFSLNRTWQWKKQLGFDRFATTLTVSPHKNSKLIFEIGAKFDGFAQYDFKKQNGFLRSLTLAKEHNLYRQNYCGCEFSKRQDS